MRYQMKHLYHFLLTLFFLLALLRFSVPFKCSAYAQDYVRLGKVGEWNNNYGEFNDVDVKEISGLTYAFCATSRGLVVYSIRYENTVQNRTKAVVSFVSFIPLGYCTDILIEESGRFEKDFYAYITERDKGLYIRDVTNPELSYHVGSCDTPGSAEGVAIATIGSREYAFVADGESGLQVIDIGDPTGPVIVSSCDTPGSAEGIAIATIGSREYAFVADGESGLQVIDIGDPTGPVIVSSCDTPGSAEGVTIAPIGSGEYAFVADGESGLQVIDIGDSTGPVIVSSCDTPGSAEGVAIAPIGSGEYAFVADGESGLQVIDIGDPTGPTWLKIVSSCDTPGYAYGVAIVAIGFREYAFVANGRQLLFLPGYVGGLQVIDIGDPTGPRIAGSYDTPGSAEGVAIATIGSGEYAFVADGESGLQVIDIGDPNGPTWLKKVGSCDTPGYAYGVAIAAIGSGEYAFVADGESGLQVIDIGDPNGPTDPNIVGSWDTTGRAYGVDIATIGSEKYAFVADGLWGLQVIDISDPTGPVKFDSWDTPDEARGVAIATIGSGEYAFVADWFWGLQVIDISDPNGSTWLKKVGSCDTPGYAYGVDIAAIGSGEYAFVADGERGLQVIDINNPIWPWIVGSCDTPGYAYGVAIATIGSTEYAFVADEGSPYFAADDESGLQVIDISDSTGPFIAGSCYTPGFAVGIAITTIGSGDYAFVADGESGLQVIDISNPTGPGKVGNWDTPGSAEGAAIATIGSGDYAFVANGVSGLQVIDISNSTGPRKVGSCDTPDYAYGVAIATIGSGDYAFVADDLEGLQVIDISNPTKPWIAGSCYTLDWAHGVAIATIEASDYAFVANEGSGLQVIYISDPTVPWIAGSCDTPGSAQGVAIAKIGSRDYAFVADGESGLQVIDINLHIGPLIIPWIVGGCPTPGSARGVAIAKIGSGDYAFVADSGLQVIDISNPTDPEIVGICDTPGSARGVAIAKIGSGIYAFVAYSSWETDYESGLQVIDISIPTDPEIVGSCDTPGSAQGVAIAKIGSGDYAFVADEKSGLLKLKINIGPPPEGKGNLILVAGGNIDYKALSQKSTNPIMRKREYASDYFDPNESCWDSKTSYWQITQALANHVFNTFQRSGYEVYDIYFFNPDPIQDIDNDGLPNQLVVNESCPTREGLMDVIRKFPEDQFGNHLANNGPLYIYLIGHAAEDRFLITPSEIITAQDLKEAISEFQNGFSDNEGTYYPGTNRQVVVIIESAASGSFIDDLVGFGVTVITSTDDGASYIKPDFSDPNRIPYNSFAKAFMDALGPHLDPNNIPEGDPNTLNTRINSILKETFIDSRDQLKKWALAGQPFADQAPQMYIPGGPIAISISPEDPNSPYDPNLPETPLIITKQDPITLIPKAYYQDGNTISLNPHHLIFLSSRTKVFDPDDPNQMEIDPNNKDHVLIHPLKARNGLCALVAYPDPDYYPDILLTARLPIEVSIPGNTIAGGDKALIVAGYRANKGIPDNIWKSTNIIANHAYLSLRKKRYSHDDIFYLSPLYKQDVDQNGKYDDINGHPRIEKIDWAINQIKQTGAEELLIFLVDHGNAETFNLNPKKGEELTAQDLKERIISLAPSYEEEKTVQRNITLLIDACYSGSFISALQNSLEPQVDPNQLIIITSTDPNETAHFFGDGLISFSYPFFDEYLLTNSIFNAYRHASRFIPSFGQTPQISDPDLARKRDKALEYYIDEALPIITDRAFSREGENLTITARAYSLSGIDRVWIIITSCEGAFLAPEDGPRTAEPTDLIPDDPNTPYGGLYTLEINDPYPDAFNYQIILSAIDKTGKVVTERTNVNNQEKNTTGAIILVTDYSAAPSISHAIDDKSHDTYLILKERHIWDDGIHNDIYYVKTPGEYTGERIDKAPTSFNMETISPWLQEGSYQVLLIYLIGESGYDAQGETYFKLSYNHYIYPSDLAAHIHTQEGCKMLLFCEMPHAREFINRFSLKPDWAAIASPYNEVPLFSNRFFSRILFFDTVGEAFNHAYEDSTIASQRLPSDYIYFPDLVPISDSEICVKLNYHLGSLEAGEDPMLIKDIQVIEGTFTLTLQLRVNESARIKTPWAELSTPSGYIRKTFLEQQDANTSLWESPPLPKDRPYTRVSFYVEQFQDANQPGITDSRELTITLSSQESGETPYEFNDTQEYAYPIVIGIPQRHTFHDTNDSDWVYFYAHEGEEYEIMANETKEGYFTLITLCDANGIMIEQEGFFNPFHIFQAWWHCNKNGYYTLRVESAANPDDIPFSYTLSVINLQCDTPKAYILGRVVDQNHEGINGLDVYFLTDISKWKTSTGSIKDIRRPAPYPSTIPATKTEGWYFMDNLPAPGSYTIKVTAKDDPNTILAEPRSTYLYENNIYLIDDVVIVQGLLPSQKDPNKEAICGFERVYNRWQQIHGGQYPPWEDTDGDGFSNLEEFLNRTDPSDLNNPTLTYTLAYNLYPGLNLFPFHLYDSHPSDPYLAYDFCSGRLEECHSIWGYNKEENAWDYWYRDSGGTDFKLEKGKGYLVYNHTPEVIYQEAQESITLTFLEPGINLTGISPIPDEDPNTSYTSFQFLRDRKKEWVKSISRYRNDRKGEYKSLDGWDTSYLFFGRPVGVEFPILPNEAYLIDVNRE